MRGAACGVDGDYLETMKTWEKDDWKAMADEIDEDLRKQGISVVKLGDRTKIRKEIERVARQTAKREAVWKERQEKLQKEKADADLAAYMDKMKKFEAIEALDASLVCARACAFVLVLGFDFCRCFDYSCHWRSWRWLLGAAGGSGEED